MTFSFSMTAMGSNCVFATVLIGSLHAFWQAQGVASGPATYRLCSLLWLHWDGMPDGMGQGQEGMHFLHRAGASLFPIGRTLLGATLPCTALHTWLLLSMLHCLLGAMLPCCPAASAHCCPAASAHCCHPAWSAADLDAWHTFKLPICWLNHRARGAVAGHTRCIISLQ